MIGFVLRRPGMEMLKLDTLSMADAATILMRSGPATLCIWSRDDILRQAGEDVIRERLPDAALLSEGMTGPGPDAAARILERRAPGETVL